MKRVSVFKSISGRENIRNYYNSILGKFPLTQRYIQTSYGKTFILEAGDKINPPLMLIHGSCSNSAAWLNEIMTLNETHHVFAVDIPGEPGNSEDNRLNIESDDYSHWLKEVLDILEIDKAILIGNSMGGWLVLHFSALYPARTKALILLASSGIIPPKQAFLHKTENISKDSSYAQDIHGELIGNAELPKEVLEFMMLVLENFNPITKALPVLSDEQMKHLTMPLLYIAGMNDQTMDTKLATQRLLLHVPQANIVVNNGAHVITDVTPTLIPFLANLQQD
jgi:pimeloyl-ACP methyl ester carboxylesterase